MMYRTHLLIVTALGEAGIGLLLLAWPPLPMTLLLGTDQASPEAAIIARVAGAALFAIGVACWLARNDPGSPGLVGLLGGVLIYDAVVAALLGYGGLVLHMAGLALWPAVGLHAALAVWCAMAIKSRGPSARFDSSAARPVRRN
jgi:hypothetical protein